MVAHCGTKKRERDSERDMLGECVENENYASSLVLLIHAIHQLNINGIEDIKRQHSEPPNRLLAFSPAPSHSRPLAFSRTDDSAF